MLSAIGQQLDQILDMKNFDDKLSMLRSVKDTVEADGIQLTQEVMDSLISIIEKSTHFKVSFATIELILSFVIELDTKIPFSAQAFEVLLDKLADDKLCEVTMNVACILFVNVTKNKELEMVQKLEQIIIKSLCAKSTKAKEQALLFIQKSFELHAIGLKAFVPSMVKLLEDANENVRNKSKTVLMSLIQNCSNPAFQDDLNKELRKQNIKQAKIDSLGIRTIASQIPVSIDKSTPAEVPVVAKAVDNDIAPLDFANERSLELELQKFCAGFEIKETEENWSSRNLLLQKFRSILKGNATGKKIFDEYLVSITDYILQNVTNFN